MIPPVLKRKVWEKPSVRQLSIRKDTFSGSGLGSEYDSKGPAYVPKDPTPR